MTEKCFKVDLERRDSSGLTGIGAEGSPLRTTGPANDKPHLPILIRRVHVHMWKKFPSDNRDDWTQSRVAKFHAP